MFKSIRWKFIVVYFLLVFIAMVIIGVFIINSFEEYQISQITKTMEGHVENVVRSSTPISKDNWYEVKEEIQSSINKDFPFNNTEVLYVISASDIPTIIATNSRKNEKLIGTNALVCDALNPNLLLKALDGEKADGYHKKLNESNALVKHLAYPVIDEVGKVKGVMYITSDLEDMYKTINESKIILTKATILALCITVFLGFLIASSITGPIKDVTVKAEKMAKGDFDQFVEVKSDDEIGQLASMFNHLTLKLKETISEMYREKSKMETIFNYMADGLLAVDIDGNIIHANPVALDILKIDIEKINDIKYDDLIKNTNSNMRLERLKKKWKGNEIIEIDGSIYRAKYAPFRNDMNVIGGLIIVLQDVTEQYKLENMRKEFVANVSHELKTPITTIKSYTETLMNGAIEEKEISSQFLSVIDSECDRMTRIVRDLLQLSNLDYNKVKWKKTSLQVKDLLDDVILKMKIAIEEKNHNLHLDVKPQLPSIYVDKDGIEQVILNILSNAIKYTPNNGDIYIIAYKRGNDIIITVKDNGIGIPDEDKDRIFERFYRVDKGRSRELGGTGLGLSISKQIVEAHNGRIVMRSKYNIGTEVDIILPIKN